VRARLAFVEVVEGLAGQRTGRPRTGLRSAPLAESADLLE
jgi:hypothetical protein